MTEPGAREPRRDLTEPVTCTNCGAVSVNGGKLACWKCFTDAAERTQALEAERDELRDWNEHMSNAFLRDERIQPDGSLRATLKDVIMRAEAAEAQVQALTAALERARKEIIEGYGLADLMPDDTAEFIADVDKLLAGKGA